MNADLHALATAALNTELPECPACKGRGVIATGESVGPSTGEFKTIGVRMVSRQCPKCDGTGKQGGKAAARLLAVLKAELGYWQRKIDGLDWCYGDNLDLTAEFEEYAEHVNRTAAVILEDEHGN